MRSLLLGLGALALAHSAAASPCGERIAKLQARFDAAPPVAGDQPLGGGDAAETTNAKLHHQPAAASAPDASAPADSPTTLRNARFRNDLYAARAADDSGDARGCEAAVNAAERELPR